MKSDKLFVLILFFVCPFLSLPCIFVEIYNKKKYPLLLLALFMGGLSMFYYPFGDQYRYYNEMVLYRNQTFTEVFDNTTILALKNINLVSIFIFYAAKLGLTLELVRFSLVFIACSISFYILLDMDKNGLLPTSKKIYFICFLILFLSTPFYLITYGFRTGIGASFLMASVYKFIQRRNISGFVFLLLAAASHFVFIIYLLLFPILLRIQALSSKKVIFFGLCMLFFSVFIINLIYGKIPFLDVMIDAYIYGKWGEDFEWDITIIRNLILNGGLGVIFSFILFFKMKNRGRIENLIFILFILVLVSIPYYTLLQRFVRSSIPILSLYLVFHISNVWVFSYRKWLIIIHIIAFMLPFWLDRYVYVHSRLDKILYSSFYSIMKNTYEEKDINNNVRPNGEFVLKKF